MTHSRSRLAGDGDLTDIASSLDPPLEGGGQGPDHPVDPAIAETRYIKLITRRLLPNS